MADKIQIVIEVEADDGQVSRTLGKIAKSASKAGDDAGKSLGDNISKSVGPGLARLGAAAAAAGAALAGALFSKAAINASIVQQDAINALNSSLARIGEFSQEASLNLQRFASELQKTTKFGDEAIIGQLAFAQSLGATAEQSKEIVAAAADMSAALGINLEAATRNITKTLGGLKGELGEVIPELGNLTKAQLQAGAAIDILSSKFAGAAAAQTQTFSGATAQLSNVFGDLLESIGDIVTKSPSLVAVIQFVSRAIVEASSALTGFSGGKDLLKPVIDTFIGVAQAVNSFVTPAIVGLSRVGDIVFQTLVVGVNTLVAGFGQLGGAVGQLLSFFGEDGALTQGLLLFAETSAITLEESIIPLADATNSLFDPVPFQERTEEFLTNLQATADSSQAPLSKLQSNFGNATKAMANSSMQAAKAISFSMNEVAARSLAFGVQSMTQSLINGTFAFKAFAQGVLGIVGDMAIKLGESAIATGIAMEAIGSLSGTKAVIAGVGLIALGTIIKSFAGSAGGLGASAAGTGGSPGSSSGFGGGGGGLAVAGPTEVAEEEQEREAPATNVSVVVNGSVFDSSETGMQLVSILNDAFDKQGVVVNNGRFA